MLTFLAQAATRTATEPSALQQAGPALVGTALLLGLSAFFSGSETALFSLQPTQRQALPEPGRTRIGDLLRHPRKTLATILIGNEVVNVALGTVTAGLVFALAPDMGVVAPLLATAMLVVFGEVMPKVLALRNNSRFATAVAGPLRLFSALVWPIRWGLTRLADGALLATGGSQAAGQAQIREELLRSLIDEGYEAGSIKPLEQEMLHKVFEFGDQPVSRLMTPRPDVFSLRVTTPWEDLLPAVREAGFSRIPVWQGSPDNIIGILLVKKLLPFLDRARRDPAFRLTVRQLKRILIRPEFVPTTKKAQAMLEEFRTERYHMGIVVDEHGTVVGVVTLDDLLAELVGELLDETDVAETDVETVSEGLFLVRGSMDIDDFAEHFGLEVPEGDYTTVGGFISARAGEVLEKGEEVDWEGIRFTVSGVEGRRVTEISLHRIDPLGDPLQTEEAR